MARQRSPEGAILLHAVLDAQERAHGASVLGLSSSDRHGLGGDWSRSLEVIALHSYDPLGDTRSRPHNVLQKLEVAIAHAARVW